jgi:hypothetical protein
MIICIVLYFDGVGIELFSGEVVYNMFDSFFKIYFRVPKFY